MLDCKFQANWRSGGVNKWILSSRSVVEKSRFQGRIGYKIMNKEEIWNVLTCSILEVLPECINRNIHLKESLSELGANSIDRVEILTLTLSQLKIKIPLVKFGEAKNLADLVEIFYCALVSMHPCEKVDVI